MANRQQDYISAVRTANRQVWEGINELKALQREWQALDYGTTLPDGEGANEFDLEGSSSVGLGTFVAGENLWQASATGVVSVELAVPVYDNQVVGGWDTTGQPLQPTETYVTAA